MQRQAHWLVTHADTQPKPAKELACQHTENETEIKHETLTKAHSACRNYL